MAEGLIVKEMGRAAEGQQGVAELIVDILNSLL